MAKDTYINHNPKPSGSNPKVPTESVQGEIDRLAKSSTNWASHKGAKK
jgi:hypothetical protein